MTGAFARHAARPAQLFGTVRSLLAAGRGVGIGGFPSAPAASASVCTLTDRRFERRAPDAGRYDSLLPLLSPPLRSGRQHTINFSTGGGAAHRALPSAGRDGVNDDDPAKAKQPSVPACGLPNQRLPPAAAAAADDACPPVAAKKPGIIAQFKDLYKRYWYVMVPVHVVTSTGWMVGFYYLSKSGVDVPDLLRSIDVSDSIVSRFEQSKMGHLAIAYLCYKIATPVRYAVTVGGTTVSIKYLSQWGLIKPMPSNERLLEIYADKKAQMKAGYEEMHSKAAGAIGGAGAAKPNDDDAQQHRKK